MEKTLEDFRRELGHIRAGRASVTLLDGVRVDYYGTATPLNQLAKLATPEATLIVVQPFDPSLLGGIDKAIRAADLGLNPLNDGKVVRVPIPPLTEERRKELVKHLHTVLENHKTALRNIRHDARSGVAKLHKEKKISDDDQFHCFADLDKITHDYTEKLEALSKTKEKEILEI
ncbi:MAG: ribosome recycling factor [Terriglobia bacterium]